MDLDELFSTGAEIGDGVLVKAQLRLRVRPPEHPVAQDILDRVVAAYDERLDLICDEIDDVLEHADSRRSNDLHLVIGRGPDGALAKANKVYAPGAKGGKWYRDGKGNIRYGTKPQGKFKQGAASGSEDLHPHVAHYRPSPFMGLRGIDGDLSGFLLREGHKYGFSGNELRFLNAWYGAGDTTGALFNAFLECTGLTQQDLSGDLAQLKFGSQGLTYEEAVFEFFAAQRSLFMGDETQSEDAEAEWNETLNDEIKPLLDSVFKKYEMLKESPEFKADFAGDSVRQRNRFMAAARRTRKQTVGVADRVVSAVDPGKQADELIAGLKVLGLLAHPSYVAKQSHRKDTPHLREGAVTDERLLSDDVSKNPLLASGNQLASLDASQLMLLYVAAELHRRWDPDSKTYSDEPQDDIGSGELGEKVLATLPTKSRRWKAAIPLLKKHLHRAVDRVVAKLNQDPDAES